MAPRLQDEARSRRRSGTDPRRPPARRACLAGQGHRPRLPRGRVAARDGLRRLRPSTFEGYKLDVRRVIRADRRAAVAVAHASDAEPALWRVGRAPSAPNRSRRPHRPATGPLGRRGLAAAPPQSRRPCQAALARIARGDAAADLVRRASSTTSSPTSGTTACIRHGASSSMTGLRRGELLGLDWDAVDLDAGRLAITRTLIEGKGAPRFSEPKTKRGRRSVALDARTVGGRGEHRQRQLDERLDGDRRTRTTDSSSAVRTGRRSGHGPSRAPSITTSATPGCRRSGSTTCGTPTRPSRSRQASTPRSSRSDSATPRSRSRSTPTATRSPPCRKTRRTRSRRCSNARATFSATAAVSSAAQTA